jgi:hypothetical protein
MPSLDEAYDHGGSEIARSRRVSAGLALLAVGALGVAVAVAFVGVAGHKTTAKSYAGVLAGLGIPAMLLGVVVVLPAGNRERIGVLAGTALAAVGVWLFWHTYPARWTRTADPLAFETLSVYGLGCAVALWFVFRSIASFRRHNVPQGTVELEIVRHGKTRTIEVDEKQYRSLVGDGGEAEELLREIDDE